ncbi:endo-1,4-beta-xylanase [Sorangium cellulosum]|uniref:cellulase n=2 Tax=Sorangium cellulosum TaxID=56 RepID=A0A2L0F2T0_SORCE|nr:endo-1,4-beta-xylanase [Sorangium cellulosum]
MNLRMITFPVASSWFAITVIACTPSNQGSQVGSPNQASTTNQASSAAPGGTSSQSGTAQASPTTAQASPAAEPAPLGPPLRPAAKGAFLTGEYRNLFAELGHKPAEIDAKITKAYTQLFHGDPKEQAVMFAAGKNANGPRAYIMDIGNNDVRSEGMSYGMMIAVQVDRKDDFDALWNWAKSHMYHADPRHPGFGYFSWQMRPDGTAIDENPAPDAEEYFATALLFASHRWGNGKGIYDYRKEALNLLDVMKNRKTIAGTVKSGKKATLASLFNAENKMVRFTPDTENFSKNGDHTDPSYHLPAFYELWAAWGPEADRAFWAEAAKVSRDFFVKTTHPKTGLAPDYANFDGTPKAASWDAGTANFRYDAFRTAMNWSVDAAWWAKDPRETELSDRILAFFESQGPKYRANFSLDGKPLVEHDSLGLVSMNGVAALAATHPRAWRFVEDVYQREAPTGKWRYYDGMLYTMSLLHLSGKFRVIMPAAQPSASAAAAVKR